MPDRRNAARFAVPANDALHDEHLAAPAREAKQRGRFWVTIEPSTDRVTSAWWKYETSTRDWPDPNIRASSFDPAFRVVLAATRGCRVFGLTKRLVSDDSAAPHDWLERHVRRHNRTVEIDLHAKGARADLAAWWWLMTSAQVVLTCVRRSFDAATFFSIGGGPMFATTRRSLSSRALTFAKEVAALPGTVAIIPTPRAMPPWTRGRSKPASMWSVIVVAGPTMIGRLATEAVRRERAGDPDDLGGERINVSILDAGEATTLWSSIPHRGLERFLISTLRRGERYPTIPRDAIRALAAAEGIARAEGFGVVPEAGSMAVLVSSFVDENVARAPRFAASTIELAIRAVVAIDDARACERARWASGAARRQFRAELQGLRKRLEIALSIRAASL